MARSKKIFWGAIFLSVFTALFLWFGSGFTPMDPAGRSTAHAATIDTNKVLLTTKDTAMAVDQDFAEALHEAESADTAVRLSEPVQEASPIALDDKAGKNVSHVYNGRRINIAVIGVDSRLGDRVKHADANHILSILLDSGIVEITSIPRDTPADAGFGDSSAQNKLTIVLANRGINAYLKEAARIAQLDKIHYYAEFGFSQAMGVLELLGHSDASSSLQVLRSRQGLGGDDFQRSYSQGQFIRQMMMRHFDKFTGALGGALTRGGLMMVETNITPDVVNEIVTALEKRSFPQNENAVTVRIRPAMGQKFKVYDFAKEETFASLRGKLERYNQSRLRWDSSFRNPVGRFDALPKLQNLLRNVEKNAAKNPKTTIARLRTFFDQRAWLQVGDKDERESIRTRFATMLQDAYIKTKNPQEAERVRQIVETEKELFSKQIFEH